MVALISCLVRIEPARSVEPAQQALAETTWLSTEFGVPIIRYSPVAGSYILAANQSLTAAALSGVAIQPDPPQLGLVPTYPATEQDAVTDPPYVSTHLQNFQFSYFNNLFNFGGLHTWPADDYARVHGFTSITSYGRTDPATVTWMSAGTNFMASIGKQPSIPRLDHRTLQVLSSMGTNFRFSGPM